MAVLIFAEKIDPTADRVVLSLRERGTAVMRVDTADIPARVGLSAGLVDGEWSGTLRAAPYDVALRDLHAVWCRSTPRCRWPDGMSEAQRRHADNQTRIGLGGTLADLSVHWVNRPAAEADAEYKPRQLRTAVRCGLRVPDTLVSTVAADVAAFTAGPGRFVIKPLGGSVVVEGTTRTVAHTHLLTADDLADLCGVELGPHMFQRWVDKDHEVRLTAVGQRMFAASIGAGSDASHVDWRSDLDALTYGVTEIPAAVRAGVLRYLESFRIVYAAFDFVVRPDGEWIFLEANPSGQFGWIQQATGLPIAEALADELAGTA